MHWRRGHWAYQVIGKKEDLVPVAQLPRDGHGGIDWPQVEESVRLRFWKSHRRVWVEPTLIGAAEDDGSKP